MMAAISPQQDIVTNPSASSIQRIGEDDDETDHACLPVVQGETLTPLTSKCGPRQENLDHNTLGLGACTFTTSPPSPLQDDTSDSSMDQNPTIHHRNTREDDDEENHDYDENGQSHPSISERQPLGSRERADSDGTNRRTLEERVQELEEKLATLSLLLSRQNHQHRHSQNNPPHMMMSLSPNALSITPPSSPPPEDFGYDSISSGGGGGGGAPVLESPALSERPSGDSSTGKHTRNLSFRVLHTEEFAEAAAAAAAIANDPSTNLGDQFEEAINGGGGGRGVSTSNFFRPNGLHKGSDSRPPLIPMYSLKQNTKSDFGGGDLFFEPMDRRSLENNNDWSHSSGGPASTDRSTASLKQPLQTVTSADSYSSPEISTASTSTPLDDDKTTPSNLASNSTIKSKWLDYLNSVQESNYDTDKHMEEFVRVPSAVEALLSFGFWICVDSFLYTLTILPIRFVWSCLLLIRFLAIRIWKLKVPADGPFRFHRRHSYQLIQVSIVYTIYKFVLLPVDISIIYHWIRVQSMVKLYLLMAIVEVFDRLMCSLGQDCLDSLYMRTTSMPRSSRMIVSVIVVLVYTALHSFLLFVHVATLNVAMNSDDQALLSLLIGGNFAEIKSTVFKKYNKASLFKIAASDICERFKLALFLSLVLTLNMSQGMDRKMVYSYFHMCGIVWCAEWLSDWIKHSFITKFNYIASGVYGEYGLLLAGDVTGIGHENLNLDHSHAVVKRLGLAQLPLVCVMAKYVKEAYKYAMYNRQPPTWMIGVACFATWSFLLVCKLSLGSFLHKISRKKLEVAPEFSTSNASVAKKKN